MPAYVRLVETGSYNLHEFDPGQQLFCPRE